MRCYNADPDHDIEKCEKESPIRCYHGSSKAQEGFAVLQELLNLQAKNVEIELIVHDKDASTMSAAKQVFPAVHEQLDIGHYRNKIKKNMETLSETYSELEYFTSRLHQQIGTAVKVAKGDIERCKQLVQSFRYHITNDHSKCDVEVCPYKNNSNHTSQVPRQYQWLDNELHKPALLALEGIIHEIQGDMEKLVDNPSTNAVESMHRIRMKYADKVSAWKVSYDMRGAMATLDKNESQLWKFNVLNMLELFPEKKVKEALEKRQQEKENKQKKAKSSKYKKQQHDSKVNKKIRTAGSSDGHSYKYCCSCMGKCDNRRCGCLKKALACHKDCACKGKCHNNITNSELREPIKKQIESTGNQVQSKVTLPKATVIAPDTIIPQLQAKFKELSGPIKVGDHELFSNYVCVLLDFETTGLNTDTSDIIEVAMLNLNTLEFYQSLCKPQDFVIAKMTRQIRGKGTENTTIAKLTGINPTWICSAQPTSTVLQSLFESVSSESKKILFIAHNKQFEEKFWTKEMGNQEGVTFGEFSRLVARYKQVQSGTELWNMNILYESAFGKDKKIEHAHRAGGDVFAMFQLLLQCHNQCLNTIADEVSKLVESEVLFLNGNTKTPKKRKQETEDKNKKPTKRKRKY